MAAAESTTLAVARPRPDVIAVESRTPPHDLGAEAAVLSVVLVDPLGFDKIAELLKPEHFYSESHRRIFEAVVALAADGKRADIVSVATWLRDQDRLAQVGGMPYLTEVLNAAPNVDNLPLYAQTVRGKWQARQAIVLCQRYVAVGYGALGQYEDGAAGYVNAIAHDIHELATFGERARAERLGTILAATLRKVQEAYARGSRIVGLSTGFDRYDRMTSGLHGGELTIVAARPGMGKTSLALNWGCNVAAALPREGEKRDGVIVFSLEMPRDQLSTRMACSEARIDLSRMRTGMLSPTDWARLTQAAVDLHKLPLWIDDDSAITVVELRAKVRRIISEAEKDGVRIALVIVDYLQLMRGSGDEQSREQEVSGISRGLKQLAKELNIPIVALSQLNRAVESRGEKKKRPQLSDLRESGAIEQDADNICFIYRDDYYDKQSADRNVAELIVAKQRNGPTDTVNVRFDAQYTRFDNLAEGYEGEEFEHG